MPLGHSRIRVTDRTLADQLQITDREIANRKNLLNLTDKNFADLRECRDYIVNNIDDIVAQFYEHQLEVPEIALLIGDAETLERLRSSMRRYIIELFDGYYDSEYVNKRLRIGKVHKRIGVSPKLYIAAIALLGQQIDAFLQNMPVRPDDSQLVERVRIALQKLLMFDIQLVFDTYISSLVTEVEAAKGQMEAYAASLEETVEERTRQLHEMSTRDSLTGLYNHRAFADHMRREISRAERTGDPLAFMYIDLNNFKKLNDLDGHRNGDKLLAAVGKALEESVRDIDIPCRYGGDEFCVIMPRTNIEDTKIVYERIIENFTKSETFGVTFSVGIASTAAQEKPDMENLIHNADRLMYEAKVFSQTQPGFHVRIQDISKRVAPPQEVIPQHQVN